MTWTFNKNYKDLDQVTEFYPAYLAVYEQITSAGQYPYNDSFKGRIPGIEGPGEDAAIYLLQQLRSVLEMEAQIAEHRADGWRDFDPDELDKTAGPAGARRYAGVAEYGWYMGGDGFREWSNARLARYYSSVMILQGRARTHGNLVQGKLLVKD